MELHKLTSDEIRGWDSARLRETLNDVRKSLATIRMDIYTAKSANAAKIKGLRKSLARLMTVKNEKGKKS
jgi:ribosomal protein L29